MIEEHVKIVLQGADSIRVWREANPGVQINLAGADLTEANLADADLTHAILMNAKLVGAHLICADLSHANLSGANLCYANLSESNLTKANLSESDLHQANFSDADLNSASLRDANLFNANLSGTNLDHSDFERTELICANLRGATLCDLKLCDATFSKTIVCDANLSNACDLEYVEHWGPSPISTSTLRLSKGQIPDVFLRGCGLQPWEVLHAKLYDPLLTPEQKVEIHNEVFQKLVGPPIGGIFISYSHENMEFVEKLHGLLDEKEYSVWRDVHGLVAGPMERQVFDAIRAHNVVLLVLSEASVNSDWVELELEKAVAKEKEQGRPVLCPIAIDDSWKAKLKQSGSQVLWRKVKEKNVLDFSENFDEAFQKLLTGMSRYYGSEQQGS